MPRRVFSGRRPGKKIDFKAWTGIPGIALGTAAAGTFQGASVAFGASATILRIRGSCLCQFDGVADNAQQFITFGLGIISSDAFAAGAGSVPDPAGEPEYDWMYWRTVELLRTFVDAAGAEISMVGCQFRFDIDSKAMRKVKPGQSLAWQFETTSAVATDIIMGQTRVLIGT